MMREKELIYMLNKQGWLCKKDEVGDYSCVKSIDDNLDVKIIPYFRRVGERIHMSLQSSISSKKFSEAVQVIFGKKTGFTPVVVSKEPCMEFASISAEDVQRLSDGAISWAQSQGLGAGLSAYRNLPTDAKGEMPLRHLAALAIAGDVERLNSYKNSFEKGDRLGFVPYITVDMIDRAILIAQKKREIIEE